MKRWQTILVGSVIATVSAISGYQFQHYLNAKEPNKIAQTPPKKQTSTKSTDTLIGTSVADFQLLDVAGKPRQLSEWQGRVIVLNFWATWCPPCKKEIPDFVELQQQYGEMGLQFIGITLQRPDEIRDFLSAFQVHYPNLVGAGDVIKLANKLGNDVGVLPYTVIIDQTGKIAFIKRGPLSKSAITAVIKPLLSK